MDSDSDLSSRGSGSRRGGAVGGGGGGGCLDWRQARIRSRVSSCSEWRFSMASIWSKTKLRREDREEEGFRFSSGEELGLGLVWAEEVESGFTRNGWKRRRLLGFMLEREMRFMMRRREIEVAICRENEISKGSCHGGGIRVYASSSVSVSLVKVKPIEDSLCFR